MLDARSVMRTARGDEDNIAPHGDEDGPEHATLYAIAILLSCSEEELLQFFGFFGEVLDVYIPTEHKGRRFGFVAFALVAAAAHARSTAHHRAFYGAFLDVQWASCPIRRRPPNGFARSRAQHGIAGSRAKNKHGVASALISENTNNDKRFYPISNSPMSLPAAVPRCVQRLST